MNLNNIRKLELSINRLTLLLEALEEYIRRTGRYPEWKEKEQFFRRTMPGYENEENKKYAVERAESHFFSQFHISYLWFRDEPENLRKETQKEFCKWIDYSGITAENCPDKLKYFLNEINEALENGNSRLFQVRQEYRERTDEELFSLLENPLYLQASAEVHEFLGYASPNETREEPKYYEVKIKGDAEQGQKTFQKIKNSITDNQEWTFPLDEKYLQKLKEKIKELEGKNQSQPNQVSPKDSSRVDIIIDTFEYVELKELELYVQKLNYYPDWEISDWTGGGEEWWKNESWKNKNADEIKQTLLINLKGTWIMLRDFKRDEPDYYPHLVNKLKTEVSQWQVEKKINPLNCPEQLKQVLFDINEVLEGNSIWKKASEENKINEDKETQIAKIIIEIKVKILDLGKNFKNKETVLGSEFNDWETKILNKSVSEAKIYQQQLEKKISAAREKHQQKTPETTNENKLPLSTKLVIGGGISLLMVGIAVIIWQATKKQKK